MHSSNPTSEHPVAPRRAGRGRAKMAVFTAALVLPLATAGLRVGAEPMTPVILPPPEIGLAVEFELQLPGRDALPVQRLPGGRLAAVVPLEVAAEHADNAGFWQQAMKPSAGTEDINATAEVEGNQLVLSVHDKQVAAYFIEPSEFPRPDIDPLHKRGGYLYPLNTPSGVTVIDDFPPQHVHHHGVWWAWTRTQFDGRNPDFWNLAQGRGRVDTVALVNHWSGAVCAGFTAIHRYHDLTADGDDPVPAIDEVWEVIVWNMPGDPAPYYLVDLTTHHRTSGDKALNLPEYHYGGLGVRGHRQWNGEENTRFLTANGETDRVAGHATKARWCHMGGDIDGEAAGIAILDDPQNFRHPQPMRLHPNEPFFCYAPQQDGDMSIEPGDDYITRHRLVVADGDPDAELLDRLADAFNEAVSARMQP